MASTLIHSLQGLIIGHSKRVQGPAMQELPQLGPGAFILIENGKVVKTGNQAETPERADRMIDGAGRFVLPSWVDSHTHLVFAGSRETEFVDRLRGFSYEVIAQRGGGILNSANRLRAMPEEELYEQSLARLEEIRQFGTGVLEIKSGYGLSLESELKILRVIRRLKETSGMPIRASFLGAHSIPMEYRENRAAYLRLVQEEMLPQVAGEGLADYIDVFCEKVAFSVAETEQLLEAGWKYGLKPKIHVNQFYALGGIPMACKQGAISVDHLEVMDPDDIQALQQSSIIATLLPTAPFFLRDPLPNARELLEAGIPVALASDYNPGTTPSGRMGFVVSLACIQMRMLPEEAINAATINGAAALEWDDEYGSLHPGKWASLQITDPIPSLDYLPYRFGNDHTWKAFVEGKEV
jgi:imidazolonepropionase